MRQSENGFLSFCVDGVVGVDSDSPPARDVSPTVGLIPARLLLLVGHVMLPSVSVPSDTVVRPIADAIPDPEDDPHGSALGKYGLVDWPPRPDQPDASIPRKCAHSERFALPV